MRAASNLGTACKIENRGRPQDPEFVPADEKHKCISISLKHGNIKARILMIRSLQTVQKTRVTSVACPACPSRSAARFRMPDCRFPRIQQKGRSTPSHPSAAFLTSEQIGQWPKPGAWTVSENTGRQHTPFCCQGDEALGYFSSLHLLHDGGTDLRQPAPWHCFEISSLSVFSLSFIGNPCLPWKAKTGAPSTAGVKVPSL